MFSLSVVNIPIVLLVWNVGVFLLYGADKSKAKKGKWRVSEASLITCGFLMGSIGALAAMSLFRHKTKHLKFRILLPLAFIVNALAAGLYFYYANL